MILAHANTADDSCQQTPRSPSPGRLSSVGEQLDKMRAARNPINRKGLGPLTELRYDE
ncbi:hypothetical protein [Mycobacterium phage LOCV5]|nr:hypothetical protein [Mycobacterium phage LOCV5]